MRIGIDARFVAYERRGIGKYIFNLVHSLVARDSENSYFIYGPAREMGISSERKNVSVLDPGRAPFPIWEQVILPRWAKRDRLDVLHCPANTAPLHLHGQIALVISIHDVMYLLPSSILQPSQVFRQRLGNAYRRVVVPRAVRSAKRIITVSEFSRAQIIEWLAIKPDSIRVTYEGVEPVFFDSNVSAKVAALQQFSSQAGYILALGAHDPRKNTERIIRVFGRLKQNNRIGEKLVIAGLRNWRTSKFYQQAQALGLSDEIFFTGYITDEELAFLYRNARCLLYPSLYEGFGLPPLEAMACGTPVITSNVASIPEIVGGAALLVDPSSDQEIEEALRRTLNDDDLQKRLTSLGRIRSAQFQWGTLAPHVMSVYQESI